MKILMLAAENDSIPGMKAGGIGDVIRDIPKALVAAGHQVDIILPAYDQLNNYGENRPVANIKVPFAGNIETVTIVELILANHCQGERQYLLVHDLFTSAGLGKIYCNGAYGQPFATDATKFALFSAAIAECLIQQVLPMPDVLHLHDWHCTFIAILAQFSPKYQAIAQLKTVYTVHNLAIQGTRPFNGDNSSLEAWYPHLTYDGQFICDPQYQHCLNPMRAGINLADKVHLVSPHYAQEVTQSSNHQQGFIGGEGLEKDLNIKEQQGNLVGILNGCEYQTNDEYKTEGISKNIDSLTQFFRQCEQALLKLTAKQENLTSNHFIALRRIDSWQAKLDNIIKSSLSIDNNEFLSTPLVTSIGRLTDQKMLLLRQDVNGKPSLANLLCSLKSHQGHMIILGSGDKIIERELVNLMAEYDNLLFINGYEQALSDVIYQLGDLFLMPSSFEPCGISQMLAMRAGQPCIVHHVGGLKDTVTANGELQNGFAFNGNNLPQQAEQLIVNFDRALAVYRQPALWNKIIENAKNSRFTWQESIKKYLNKLYQ